MHTKLIRAVTLSAFATLTTLSAYATNDNYHQIDNKVYALQDKEDWKESALQLPPYPEKPNWQAFYVPLKPGYKFFVDADTLTLGDDGVIRFTLRMLSPSGAENLSYEGIHCGNRNTRAYAFADETDKKWISSTRALWKKINDDNPVRQRLAEDMCPQWDSPGSSSVALERIKKAPWN